jgi:hypothetical protein
MLPFANDAARFFIPLRDGIVEERLKDLMRSEFVITDSFHGVCMAIIFEIPFIAILNPLRGSDRFVSLLSKFDLVERMVSSFDEAQLQDLMNSKPDWTKVKRALKVEILRCRNWLVNSIELSINKKAYSTEDVLRKKMDLHVNDIEARLKNFSFQANYLLKFFSADDIEKRLKEFDSIDIYLHAIKMVSKKRLTVICVRDTPGLHLTREISDLIKNLGFSTDLCDKHWHGYIGVIYRNEVMHDEISFKINQNVLSGLNIGKLKLEIASKPYNSGDASQVIIDGIDYSTNSRGLNIVVYDIENNLLVDSVCFDTHLTEAECSRRIEAETQKPKFNLMRSSLIKKLLRAIH